MKISTTEFSGNTLWIIVQGIVFNMELPKFTKKIKLFSNQLKKQIWWPTVLLHTILKIDHQANFRGEHMFPAYSPVKLTRLRS